MKRLLAALLCLCLAHAALGKDQPYDESADVKSQIAVALKEAKAHHVPLLLIFGANWCEDCRALDATLKKGRNAELLAKEFRVIKVDVGNFDKNLEVVSLYGDPIKAGIPAAAIVSSDNQLLYVTRAGELADARRMNDESIERFFARSLSGLPANK